MYPSRVGIRASSRTQREQQDAARAAHSYRPPFVGRVASEASRVGVVVIARAVSTNRDPHPQPLPTKGGGEQSECAAKANDISPWENERGVWNRELYFLTRSPSSS